MTHLTPTRSLTHQNGKAPPPQPPSYVISFLIFKKSLYSLSTFLPSSPLSSFLQRPWLFFLLGFARSWQLYSLLGIDRTLLDGILLVLEEKVITTTILSDYDCKCLGILTIELL